MKRRHFITAGLGLSAIGLSLYWKTRWRAITVHHSAGGFGNLEHLRQVHRDRQPRDPIDEIPYHFLIGNGRGLAMGQVVASNRWRLALWGAHLSARNHSGNFQNIGICLIGNFETAPPERAQYEATLLLCQDLMTRFRIPPARVGLHGQTPGERTLCPGKYFPAETFFNDIARVA